MGLLPKAAQDPGRVYKLDGSGNETVLCNFGYGANGQYPLAGVILDTGGQSTGPPAPAAQETGASCIKLSPSGQETVLYSFTGGVDGDHPQAGVIRDSAGNLYGIDFTTAAPANAGCRVQAGGEAARETVLYSFKGGGDGMYPYRGCGPRHCRQPLRDHSLMAALRKRRYGVQAGCRRESKQCCMTSAAVVDGGYPLTEA